MRNNTEKANEFLQKAKDLLEWGNAAFDEMHEHSKHARIDSIRRSFFSLLGFIEAAYEALGAAARSVNQKPWDANLKQQRIDDPLLDYFWGARNVDFHHVPIKWVPQLSSFTYRIVDINKFDQATHRYFFAAPPHLKMLCYLLEARSGEDAIQKFFAGKLPTPERMTSGGVELEEMLHTLQLVPFTGVGKVKNFSPPKMHLGKQIEPVVNVATRAVLDFYQAKLGELSELIVPNEVRLPSPPATDPCKTAA
jgi:hypothetical protein